MYIYILGGIGGFRLEYSYVNFLLLFDYDDVSIIISELNVVKYCEGIYYIKFIGFINIFS